LEKASENPEIISELEQQVQAGGARANDKVFLVPKKSLYQFF
jgi:hypothetical protein